MTLDHETRLRRGQRFWDLGARVHSGRIRALEAPLWPQVVATLRLEEGGTVLDVGCGTGNGFRALREAVGPTGRVVGIDNSPRMLARARAVVAEHGWDNVEVRHADASAVELESAGYDAAVAATSLSTLPDLDAALERIYGALRPGARIFVLDMHFGPHPGARLLRAFYRRVMGGNGEDVVAAMRRHFDAVEPVVGDDGTVHVPAEGRSWPPVFAAVACRAAS
jgi:ubiquinone/menaquinone biosynthesis C-methylase UbiE